MINISNLTSKKTGKDTIFADLNLNFEEKQVSGNKRSSDVAAGNDLVIDYDVEAIRNAIRNILFQKRYLTNMNVDIKGYIGENISNQRAIALGEEIERGLALFEPRINVKKIYVGADIDTSTYFINMVVTVLNFNVTTSISASLDRNGVLLFINI